MRGKYGKKLWLDDTRPAPDETWTLCRSAGWALHHVVQGYVEHISFDHDLGAHLTGYDVASEIAYMAHFGMIPRLTWNIHSANIPGSLRIAQAMERAEKDWTRVEETQRKWRQK